LERCVSQHSTKMVHRLTERWVSMHYSLLFGVAYNQPCMIKSVQDIFFSSSGFHALMASIALSRSTQFGHAPQGTSLKSWQE
jgi:hypothetical protein